MLHEGTLVKWLHVEVGASFFWALLLGPTGVLMMTNVSACRTCVGLVDPHVPFGTVRLSAVMWVMFLLLLSFAAQVTEVRLL